MSTPTPVNVAAVFGTSRPIAFVLTVLISITNLVLLLLDPTDGIPRPGAWVTWALITLGAVALFFPRGDPLAARWTGLVAAAAVLAASAVFWDPPSETSGYAPWYIRSATILLVVLILRRRPAAAWIGAALMAAIVLTWASVSGEELGGWIGVLGRQLVTFVPIQITAIGLARAARTIAAYRAEETERVRSEELRSASLRERRRELAAIRSLSAPILARIARGDDDPALREEAILVEASLRDVLRGRRMTAEPLTSAVLEARRRGIDVTLLDDLGDGDLGDRELDDAQRAAAFDWAAERTRAATAATTIRLSQGSAGPIVTVVTGDDDIVSREL